MFIIACMFGPLIGIIGAVQNNSFIKPSLLPDNFNTEQLALRNEVDNRSLIFWDSCLHCKGKNVSHFCKKRVANMIY